MKGRKEEEKEGRGLSFLFGIYKIESLMTACFLMDLGRVVHQEIN
jgi:hypothetical protein